MIKLEHINIGYPNRLLVEDANVEFSAGELTALLGRNGTGKSTLLRAIAGLEMPLSGQVIVDNTPLLSMTLLERASKVSFVTTERARIANLRCEDLVALGRAPYTNWLGRIQEQDRDIVMRSLELVGMSHFASRSVERLSDGELQRVMIARALAQQTPIILLDEPTAFLDMPSRYELVDLLTNLTRSEKKAIIFSTHELDIAQDYCDTIALIDTPSLKMLSAQEATQSGIMERLFNIRKRRI